ncbi:copper resistance CopC/CopD family protein [Streptomyces sp. BBFR2]|uniref:copper resistance CopC/CopD family protein n=1 Tax=Streptomyces sp. BBFR2 TaxID=3372854 RepID=UPI0037D9F68A
MTTPTGTAARPRRGAVRLRRAVAARLPAVAVALCTLLLATAAPAQAHAALTGSDPAQGAVVAHAPEQVTLSFSEGVAMGDDSVRVLDPHGTRVDRGKLRDLCSGESVKYGTGLPPGLPDGTYTVAWQAVSADSHPVSGAFTFSIGAPSATKAPLPQQEAGGGPAGALYGVARYLAYAGFVLLFGGAAFVLLCRPAAAGVRSVQRLTVHGGWVLLTAATLALLLLRGPYTGSGDLAGIADLDSLRAVLATKTGIALTARLLLLAAAALFVTLLFGAYERTRRAADAGGVEGAPGGAARTGPAPGEATAPGPTGDAADPGSPGGPAQGSGAAARVRLRRLTAGLTAGGALLAVATAATWSFAEHASTGLQPGLAIPVDLLHLLAVATWLGGLAALVVSLYWGPPVERAAVRRFSRLAFGSVLALVATGLYQSWRQVGTVHALTGTAYGRLLMFKAGLVLLLVGLAWISRRWTGRLTENEAGAGAGSGTEAGTAEAAGTAPATVPGQAPAPGTETDAAADPAAEPRPEAAPDTPGEPAADPAAPARAATPERTGADARPAPALRDAPDSAPEAAPPAPVGETAPDPVRAAQLARQRAALSTARVKRERDADPQRLGLRRSVLAEAGVAVVVLAVTTVLTGTEPARTEAALRAASAERSPDANQPRVLTIPFDTGGPHGEGTARIDLDPGRAGGGNQLRVRISDPSGATMDVPEMKVSFTLGAQRLGPLPVAATHTGKGHWSATDVQLPVPGRWQLSLLVRTSDIDQVTETRNVTIDR